MTGERSVNGRCWGGRVSTGRGRCGVPRVGWGDQTTRRRMPMTDGAARQNDQRRFRDFFAATSARPVAPGRRGQGGGAARPTVRRYSTKRRSGHKPGSRAPGRSGSSWESLGTVSRSSAGCRGVAPSRPGLSGDDALGEVVKAATFRLVVAGCIPAIDRRHPAFRPAHHSR